MSRNGRGVERDHLDWASEAARREGLSLEDWLDSRPIADRSLDPAPRYASPEPAYGRTPDRTREAGSTNEGTCRNRGSCWKPCLSILTRATAAKRSVS